MGLDEWMNRKVAPIAKAFCMEDYPGYTHAVMSCLSCEGQFEGLFHIEPSKIICPRCQTRGVKVIKRLRKVYLQ